MTQDSIQLTLSGPAARWVQLLQEFGHIDPAMADQLIMAAADLHTEMQAAGTRIELHQVRRAAAIMMFGNGAPITTPLLDEDWPLLFS